MIINTYSCKLEVSTSFLKFSTTVGIYLIIILFLRRYNSRKADMWSRYLTALSEEHLMLFQSDEDRTFTCNHKILKTSVGFCRTTFTGRGLLGGFTILLIREHKIILTFSFNILLKIHFINH